VKPCSKNQQGALIGLFQKGGESMTQTSIQTILETLTNTRDKVVKEVASLHDTQLNAKPKREKWSIAQNLHHLHLVEQAVTSAITYALHKTERVQVTLKPVQATLNRAYKREAPEQMKPTDTIMKQDEIQDLLQTSRRELLHVIHSVTDERDLFEKAAKHPVFGEINVQQWLEFLDYHEKRHLAQIQEAKRALHS
jgi:uncharacterized damage-inducible protein DinB